MLDLSQSSVSCMSPWRKDGRKCQGLERPKVERKVLVDMVARKLMSPQHPGRAAMRNS